jgi:hypothetical protein
VWAAPLLSATTRGAVLRPAGRELAVEPGEAGPG